MRLFRAGYYMTSGSLSPPQYFALSLLPTNLKNTKTAGKGGLVKHYVRSRNCWDNSSPASHKMFHSYELSHIHNLTCRVMRT